MGSPQALVVDDSRSARKVLERMLQKANLQVTTVEHAEAALEYLQKHQPAIIFMDHIMPGMDGLAATATIKQQPQLAHIPTIMYTSKDDEDYIAQAKACGASDVLSKPAKQAELEHIIRLYLSTESESKPSEDLAAQQMAESLAQAAQPTEPPQPVMSKLSQWAVASDQAKSPNIDLHTLQADLETKLSSAFQKQLESGLKEVTTTISDSFNAQLSNTNSQLNELQTSLFDLRATLTNVQKSTTPTSTPVKSNVSEATKNTPIKGKTEPTKAEELPPLDTLKSLQPMIQHATKQVAQKLIDTENKELRINIKKANNLASNLQNQFTKQEKLHKSQMRHLKLLAFSGAITAAVALAGVAALFNP